MMDMRKESIDLEFIRGGRDVRAESLDFFMDTVLPNHNTSIVSTASTANNSSSSSSTILSMASPSPFGNNSMSNEICNDKHSHSNNIYNNNMSIRKESVDYLGFIEGEAASALFDLQSSPASAPSTISRSNNQNSSQTLQPSMFSPLNASHATPALSEATLLSFNIGARGSPENKSIKSHALGNIEQGPASLINDSIFMRSNREASLSIDLSDVAQSVLNGSKSSDFRSSSPTSQDSNNTNKNDKDQSIVLNRMLDPNSLSFSMLGGGEILNRSRALSIGSFSAFAGRSRAPSMEEIVSETLALMSGDPHATDEEFGFSGSDTGGIRKRTMSTEDESLPRFSENEGHDEINKKNKSGLASSPEGSQFSTKLDKSPIKAIKKLRFKKINTSNTIVPPSNLTDPSTIAKSDTSNIYNTRKRTPSIQSHESDKSSDYETKSKKKNKTRRIARLGENDVHSYSSEFEEEFLRDEVRKSTTQYQKNSKKKKESSRTTKVKTLSPNPSPSSSSVKPHSDFAKAKRGSSTSKSETTNPQTDTKDLIITTASDSSPIDLLNASRSMRVKKKEDQIKIGFYSLDERKIIIEKFLRRRKLRVWQKKIKYNVRKDFADSRLRVKGRFVRKEDEDQLRDIVKMIF